MNKLIVILITLLLTGTTYAIEDTDYFTNMGSGNTFTVEADIILIANKTSFRIDNSIMAGAKCYLQMSASKKERVLRAGRELIVTDVQARKVGTYSAFVNTVVFGEISQDLKLKCYTKFRQPSGYIDIRALYLGEAKDVLDGRFSFTPAEPEEL